MKSVIDIFEERISAAMAAAAGPLGAGQKDYAAIVRPSTDPKFGDYQVNGVMALAKKIKTNPRTLAQEVVKRLEIDDICEPLEIAGPGFINLRLKPNFVAAGLSEINNDPVRLGVDKVTLPKTVVVDFSGPNIAKQMHVGHLRSTIIGDCICRLLEFEGYKVIRQNHIGDWGTQFGMLACYLDQRNIERDAEYRKKGLIRTLTFDVSISDMEEFYREAKKLFDSDPEFADRSRKYVVELHSSNRTHAQFNWEIIRSESLSHCFEIYNLLGVNFDREREVRGESFYKDMLVGVVAELKKKGLAVESEGAVCVFPVDSTGSPQAGIKDKEGKPLPVIVQKSDGAYLYATTDLAAIRYRTEQLKADRIIYVTDSRQSLHFEMVFAVARMAGWVADKTELIHVTFGSVLGENGKPLKTRSGENVKLKELLDEAVERARAVVEEKNPELSTGEKEKIAKAVGIGAVKYADYSNNRTSDYIFSFNRMLAMEGNTAPYMQYAYARIKSIGRKAQERGIDDQAELRDIKEMNLTEPAELDLAKHLIGYGVAIEIAVSDYRPNYLTNYLYELAQKFSVFYANCPVLAAEPAKRPTRLLLCDLTARTIRHGLSELLGIDVVEQM